jgi:hypothetical protein
MDDAVQPLTLQDETPPKEEDPSYLDGEAEPC